MTVFQFDLKNEPLMRENLKKVGAADEGFKLKDPTT